MTISKNLVYITQILREIEVLIAKNTLPIHLSY
jgi:hypothetical protein